MTTGRDQGPASDALASGVRLRIIRLTRNEALTNKQLAERLGLDPSTALHHVRKLVAAGYLTAQESRRGKRGAREIPYRSSGLPWARGPEGQKPVAQAIMDAFFAEAGELDMAVVNQIRFVLDLSPERRAEFIDRLDALLDEFDHDPPGDSTERTAVYMALYPQR